jgi:hypothetical protein
MVLSFPALSQGVRDVGFRTIFEADMVWCSGMFNNLAIPAGEYISYGYESYGFTQVSINTAIANSPLAGGFIECSSEGNTIRGVSGGNAIEIQMNPSGQSFAVYIYFL